ncbi:hypothetical protein [Mesorhizobium sp. L103C131B0]|uniref:hypothetical protein n=1 Tax=Mesorhizobium sp. L103C131B0 TaxID=1287089 RepID=UPI0012DFDFD2|nr:hypothetical protein [Mesorhizobium sp. L103C131B0]
MGQVDRSHQPRKGAIFALQRHRFLAMATFFIDMHGWAADRAGYPSGEGRLEGDLAIRQAFEFRCASADEIEEVVVPNIHTDDAPTAGKGLREP